MDTEARVKVRQVLTNVDEVTLLQSEDPGWFLARAFRFTSRTSQTFIRAICDDYENKTEALSYLISGKPIDYSHVNFPSSKDETKQILLSKLVAFCHSLNIITKTATTSEEQQEAVSTILFATTASLQGKTKNDILSLLSAVGHRQPQSVRKPQLIEKVIHLKEQVESGACTLNSPVEEATTPLQVAERKKDKLLNSIYKASLSSWIMKPLVSTPGMKEGSFNESQVLRALPSFFSSKKVIPGLLLCSELSTLQPQHYSIDYIRTTGLISSRRDPMISDIPDAVLCFTDSDGIKEVCAVEIKTMTSLNTVDGAMQRRHKHAAISHIRNVGQNDSSNKLFHELVPSTEYRIQCLHHAVALNLKHVMFVEAKGSNLGVGGIIYITIVHFHHTLTSIYSYLLAAVRVAALDWIGKDSKNIPKAYDDILQTSHASDLNSFASYYSLSQAYLSLAHQKGTLPPAQMIRPTAFVYWNYLKGGVDEFSRAMTSLCYTNVAENLIVSIIRRLLCSQINNAACIHRSSIARQTRKLPTTYNNKTTSGYREIRKKVAKCSSFADYARNLAKEYVQAANEKEKIANCTSNNINNSSVVARGTVTFKPLYSRNIAEQYNKEDDKKRRLENRKIHHKMNGKQTYCSLCSYSTTITKNGKKFRKKGGARQKLWCSLCRQAICFRCWPIWHSVEKLERAKIPEGELQKLQEK